MLPEIDGIELCRKLKSDELTKAIPVIMVTAKGEESDVVLGLGVGADDYVTKPFSPKELVARVKAVLRRSYGREKQPAGDRIVRAGVVIDIKRHEVKRDGESVKFTATELRLLHFLASHPGRVFTRDQLMTRVIGEDAIVIDRNIDVHVRSIRKKLGTYRISSKQFAASATASRTEYRAIARLRIFWKLFGGYAVVVIISTFVLSPLIVRNVERALLEESQRILKSEVLLLRDIASPFFTTGADSAFQQRIWTLGARTSMRFTVIRADGIVIADSREDPGDMDNHRNRPEVLEALARGVGSATRYSRTLDTDMMYVAIPVQDNNDVIGFVRASEDVQHVDRRIGEVRRLTFYGGALAIVLALVVGLLLARGFSKPLVEMTTAAGAIAGGDYARKIDIRRGDEIGKLAEALDVMTSQLREHITTITADRNQTLAIFSGMVEGVLAVNRQEQVVLVNRAAERILSVDTDPIGRRIWEVTRLREVADATRDAMTREQLSITEARIPGPEKDQVIQLIATPLRGAEDQLEGAIVVLHDVSELRQLEQIRRDFIANISHELKTPLAAIRGLVKR